MRGSQRPAGFVPGGFCVFMKEIIKTYLEWKGTYASRAAINYRIWLHRFVEVCQEKRVEDYTITDFIIYRKWLETRYNPYTVQFATIVLKNFFMFCKNQNLSCLNPALIKLHRIMAKSHRAVSEKEYELILKTISNEGHDEFRTNRDSLMIMLLWDTGVRVSELTDLELSQFDENKRSTVIKTKKTGYPRTIVWSEKTHELLKKYISLRLKRNALKGSSALFVGWKNGIGWTMRLTPRSVERLLKGYVQKANIQEKLSPHSFRHGWAHKRRDQNAPLAFIQRGLGHISPVSTFVYEQYKDVEFESSAQQYLN